MTDLSTIEFQDYIMEITAYYAGYGVLIPEPNEVIRGNDDA